MQLLTSDLLHQLDVDRPFLPTVDPKEIPTHTDQDLVRARALQDAIALGLDPSLRARALHQEEDVAEEVVDVEQARPGMVAGGEEAQVIAATAVMMIVAEAEVGDTEGVEDVKCTMN